MKTVVIDDVSYVLLSEVESLLNGEVPVGGNVLTPNRLTEIVYELKSRLNFPSDAQVRAACMEAGWHWDVEGELLSPEQVMRPILTAAWECKA